MLSSKVMFYSGFIGKNTYTPYPRKVTRARESLQLGLQAQICRKWTGR